MAALRRFELDDLINRPGTYVNPQTEVLIIVDDSTTVDAELLQEAGDDGEWVLVSDEAPIDEARRDELLEGLQRRAQASSRPVTPLGADLDEAETETEDEPDFASAGFDDPSAYEEEEEEEEDY